MEPNMASNGHEGQRRSAMARALRVLFGVMSSTVLIAGMATLALSTPAAAVPNPWAIVSSPNATSSQPNNYLSSVSCTGPSFCVAVGNYFLNPADQTLIETWNGTAWSIVSSPNVSTSQNNQLLGVSCTSPSSCVAVGYHSNGSINQTLAETWNGSAWSIASSPSPGSADNVLYGVSCRSASFCVAVGHANNSANQTLVESWNGSAWSIVSSPNTSTLQDNSLRGVSCTGPSSCVAAGFYNTGTHDQTLVESWNGSAWSIVSSPNTSTSQFNELEGVSCTSPSFCVATGQYFNGTFNLSLIETWNGSAWIITSSPNPSTSQGAFLNGVSCTSVSSCVAVGYSFNPTFAQTLIETWNGSAWSITSSPNPSTTQTNQLIGVSCTSPSPSFCVAVGHFNNGTNDKTLIESMTGSAAPVLGYWTDAADGGIFTFGQAQFHGSMGGIPLNKPVVGMAPTADGGGYWMDASDGGIFSFGDAKFHGSMGGQPLNQPVVGMAPTPDGGGYWLVASDGGIFTFGDAKFHGSTGGLVLNKPIVGMAVTPDGLGYWLVASDGGVFAFGSAQFHGSMGDKTLNKPMVGIAPTGNGAGYWMDASDGGIFSFGDAKFHGSMGGKSLNKPMVGMASTPDGGGYWMDASDGGIFTFGNATFFGSMGGKPLNAPMVGMATFTQPVG
jgi:hypothetical protein